MDSKIRKLEHKVSIDPSLRYALLSEYMRQGIVSQGEARVCALLGQSECQERTGIEEIPFDNIFETNLPKKAFLALGLGGLVKMESLLHSAVDDILRAPEGVGSPFMENFQEMQRHVHLCRLVEPAILAIFNKQAKDEIFNVSGFRVPLSPNETLGLIQRDVSPFVRRARYSLAMADRVEIPLYFEYYLIAYLAIARAYKTKPGLRSGGIIGSCVSAYTIFLYPDNSINSVIQESAKLTPSFQDAAKKYVFSLFLGPYF